jgi:SAM-dependent methyltransferase
MGRGDDGADGRAGQAAQSQNGAGGSMTIATAMIESADDRSLPARAEWLAEQVAANRFLPMPPPSLAFVGDGDFRAIGTEFLKLFIQHCGLAPHERVLDIGSGIGRMAIPLTQYLQPGVASYDGVDIVAPGVAWCRENVSVHYPDFRFHHLDCTHPVYNPDGKLPAVSRLPFEDHGFDFIFLTSVITHLSLPEVGFYAAEIARLLAPGGRALVTAFLMNAPARAALARGGGRLPFAAEGGGPEHHAYADSPLAAVAFDEDALLSTFFRAGLRRRRPVRYGHWSGRELPDFQDICIFEPVTPS